MERRYKGRGVVRSVINISTTNISRLNCIIWTPSCGLRLDRRVALPVWWLNNAVWVGLGVGRVEHPDQPWWERLSGSWPLTGSTLFGAILTYVLVNLFNPVKPKNRKKNLSYVVKGGALMQKLKGYLIFYILVSFYRNVVKTNILNN